MEAPNPKNLKLIDTHNPRAKRNLGSTDGDYHSGQKVHLFWNRRHDRFGTGNYRCQIFVIFNGVAKATPLYFIFGG